MLVEEIICNAQRLAMLWFATIYYDISAVVHDHVIENRASKWFCGLASSARAWAVHVIYILIYRDMWHGLILPVIHAHTQAFSPDTSRAITAVAFKNVAYVKHEDAIFDLISCLQNWREDYEWAGFHRTLVGRILLPVRLLPDVIDYLLHTLSGFNVIATGSYPPWPYVDRGPRNTFPWQEVRQPST